MRRRDLVKLLAWSAALPAVPAELFAACREVCAGLGETPGLKLLSAQQNATVTAMAECILPQTETPGAKATRVNEFIDLILAEWYDDKERDSFLSGLAGVDARTEKLFGKKFAEANAEQQGEILRLLGDEMVEARQAQPDDGESEDPFYQRFRDLTLTGYFTSEAGYTQQLGEEIIPGRWDACIPAKSAGAAAKGAE